MSVNLKNAENHFMRMVNLTFSLFSASKTETLAKKRQKKMLAERQLLKVWLLSRYVIKCSFFYFIWLM